MKKAFLLLVFYFLFKASNFATVYTWNGSVSSDWNTAANWTPSTGIPGATDDIIIALSSSTLLLDASHTVNNFALTSGTIDLNGFILTINGGATYTAGIILNGLINDAAGRKSTFGLGASGPTINASIIVSSDTVTSRNTTFNNTVQITKTGASNDNWNGGNTFNGVTEIINNGTGRLRLAHANGNTFSAVVTFTNTGSNRLEPAYNSSTSFNENIIVNSTGGTGVQFGGGTGTWTLAAGKTINIGATGFSVGTLLIENFAQLDNTPLSLSLSGTAILTLGNAADFLGNVVFSSPQLYLNGATYHGTATFEKTGASSNSSNGGNTFMGVTEIKNSGSNFLRLALNTGDTFNDDVTFTSTGSSLIDPAYSGTNVFNGNIIVNSSGSSTGVQFGVIGGTSTLAGGKTISVGAEGFTTGTLELSYFTQNGGTAQNLSLTGNALLKLGSSSTFNADVNFVSPQLQLNGSTFNGVTILEKNGITNNTSDGGNIFNNTTTITNSSTARLRLASTNPDDFNSDLTFIESNTGAIQPAYTGINTFSGNITVNSSSAISFGINGGTVLLDEGDAQTINKSGTANPNFYNLQINKPSSNVTLNTEIAIVTSATFTQGNIVSSNPNYFTVNNSATVSGASNASYVAGPVRKVGNQAFTFPIGKSGYYRPIAISEPTNTSHHFTAEYFSSNPCSIYGTTRDADLDHLSQKEYWILDRTNGSSDVSVTLSWGANSGGVDDLSKLRVARWNGTQWKDEGNGGTSGNNSEGTVGSSAAITSFSPFTLASADVTNPLPVELISFKANPERDEVKIEWTVASENNLRLYSVEKSRDGQNFIEVISIDSEGNNSSIKNYSCLDNTPFKGLSYYRLKSIDINNSFKYSNPVSININENKGFKVYPTLVSESVFIKTPSNNSFVMEVFDLKGNSILKKEINCGINSVNLSGLEKGFYFVKISSEKENYTSRIIKN